MANVGIHHVSGITITFNREIADILLQWERLKNGYSRALQTTDEIIEKSK